MNETPDKSSGSGRDFSRRSFLKGVSATSLGVAITGGSTLLAPVSADPNSKIVGPNAVPLTLNVNGKDFTITVSTQTTLAEALRDHLHFTGTKIGCDRAACGACTVLLDGKTVPACMTLALDAMKLPIQTVEGLSTGDKLHPIQEAFVHCDALQCGFCTSGMVMSCKSLLDRNAHPTTEEIRHAVSGNLCRCGTYSHVVDAVQKLSKGE